MKAVSPSIGIGPKSRVTATFSRRDLMEALLLALGFLLYFGVRGAVIDRPETAYSNALDIIDLQRRLGIFWEADLNEWTSHRPFWAQVMNIIYFWLHFPLIIAFAIWLYYFRRNKYTFLRDAFLASGAIALVVYWLYPVAPPRELPQLAAQFDPDPPVDILGFVDTLQKHLGYAYQTQSTRPFVNPYAAMPSLHFGWNLLLGYGITRTFWGERWAWIMAPVGVSLPIMQAFSMIMTANHFIVDAAAGAAVAVVGLFVAIAMRQWAYPVLGQAATRIRRHRPADA